MGQPELVYVIGWKHLTAFCVKGRADVSVTINEAWRSELAMAVDLARAVRGAASGVYRKPGDANRCNFSDEAIFYNDIGGPPRWGAGTVNDSDASKHQAGVWPIAAIIAGGGFDLAKAFLGETGDHFFAYLN
ncbi:hypothetical protein LRS56_18045 [Pseudomonas poae]|nr:hypothetical protein LRS56_18045 [Pseudomonas poae]